jgi:DNA replication and repair protein RecF
VLLVLLDDMTAELDAAAQTRLITLLMALESQVFITTVDLEAVLLALKNVNYQTALFHLQDGEVVSNIV